MYKKVDTERHNKRNRQIDIQKERKRENKD